MEDLPSWLSNSTILLDTNFFIDAYVNQKVYNGFIIALKRKNVALASTTLVKYEFVRSRTIDVVQLKEKYFYEIVDSILPHGEEIDSLVVPTIKDYKNKMLKKLMREVNDNEK